MQKRIGQIFKIASIVLSVLAFAALVIMMFMPAVNIHVEGNTNTEFDFANGQDFVGWQVIFYYWGPNIPIGDRAAFRTNIPLTAIVIVCVFALVICTLMVRKAKGVKCLVVEIVLAAVLIAAGCMFLNILTLLESSVGNLVADTLFAAQANGGYTMCPMVTVTAAVMFAAAAVKLVDGVLGLLAGKEEKASEGAANE